MYTVFKNIIHFANTLDPLWNSVHWFLIKVVKQDLSWDSNMTLRFKLYFSGATNGEVRSYSCLLHSVQVFGRNLHLLCIRLLLTLFKCLLSICLVPVRSTLILLFTTVLPWELCIRNFLPCLLYISLYSFEIINFTTPL